MEVAINGFEREVEGKKRTIRAYIVNSMDVAFPGRKPVIVSFRPRADRFSGSVDRGDYINIIPSCHDNGGDAQVAEFTFVALQLEGEVEVVISPPVVYYKVTHRDGKVMSTLD